MNTAKATLRDPELRRLRALTMVNRKVVQAMTHAAIAAEFHVSERTVEREIDWAKRQGLITDAEDRLLGELIPAALGQVLKAIGEGHTEAALEILKGTGLLKKPQVGTLTAPAPQEPAEESLEVYVMKAHRAPGAVGGARGKPFKSRAELAAGAATDIHGSALPAGADNRPAVVEAELLPSGGEAGPA